METALNVSVPAGQADAGGHSWSVGSPRHKHRMDAEGGPRLLVVTGGVVLKFWASLDSQ